MIMQMYKIPDMIMNNYFLTSILRLSIKSSLSLIRITLVLSLTYSSLFIKWDEPNPGILFIDMSHMDTIVFS